MRIRLLPILILVAALGVATRLGGVVVEFSGQAQADGKTPGTTVVGATGRLPDQPRPAEPVAAAPGETQEARAAGPESGATPVFQRTASSPDPLDLTDEEIDLLQSLAARREQLERRERQIDQRGALLSAAEARVAKKIAELETLKATIEELLAQYDIKSDNRTASLVKIYSSMKPKDAARILEELESAVLLQVIQQMPERISASILAEMSAKRAKAITVELAEAHALPLARE